jgi:hypothetical protein
MQPPEILHVRIVETDHTPEEAGNYRYSLLGFTIVRLM